jgi:hypothetical protein
VDASGNLFVTGGTLGALAQSNISGMDGFIRKYDPAGAVLWTVQFGGPTYTLGMAASTLDSQGNVFVTGSYTSSSTSASEAYLAKHDSAGKLIWSNIVSSTGPDGGAAIGTDSAGNVFVGGSLQGALFGQTPLGSADAFLSKYDAAGNELWMRRFGTTQDDFVTELSTDGSGNVYVGGITEGALSGQSAAGNRDAFVRKYDANGEELWTRQFGTSGMDSCDAATVDAAGKLYVAGAVGGALDNQVAIGEQDGFVRRYASDGTLEWTTQFGTAIEDYVGGVAVDAAGNVFVAGLTAGTLPGQTFKGGAYDGYVLKLLP